MKSYTFVCEIKSYVTIEAEDIESAFDKLGDIDPIGGEAELYYDEWDVASEFKED